MIYTITAVGQDSHRFDVLPSKENCRHALRPLILGGVEFQGELPLRGNSDADVVLHALCRAIAGITNVNILGSYAERMRCDGNVMDSMLYVKEAMKHLLNAQIVHVSFSIECLHPIIDPLIDEMRSSIAQIIGINFEDVCITATSGEGLTDFGRGLGIQVLCIITVLKKCGSN